MKFKKTRAALLLLLLLLLLPLSACSFFSPSASPDASLSERLSALEERVTRLEAKDAKTEVKETKETVKEEETKADPLAAFTFRQENGETILLSYRGDDEEVVIPAAYEGLPVTAIERRAFAGASVKKITLPDTLRVIGWFAFYECYALREIVIPASVTEIGYAALDGTARTLTVICPLGCFAETYAKSYGIAVKTE